MIVTFNVYTIVKSNCATCTNRKTKSSVFITFLQECTYVHICSVSKEQRSAKNNPPSGVREGGLIWFYWILVVFLIEIKFYFSMQCAFSRYFTISGIYIQHVCMHKSMLFAKFKFFIYDLIIFFLFVHFISLSFFSFSLIYCSSFFFVFNLHFLCVQ